MPDKRSVPPGPRDKGDFKRSRPNDESSSAEIGGQMTEEERKKALIAERIAAIKGRMAAKPAAAAPVISTPAPSAPANIKEDALARIAAMKARLASGGTASPAPTPRSPASPAQSTSPANGAAPKNAEAQARIAALSAKVSQNRSRQAAPPPPPTRIDTVTRGGLGIAVHPALRGDAAKVSEQEAQAAEKKKRTHGNPYLSQDENADGERDPSVYDPRLGKARSDRKGRDIVFNQKGKFIAQAEALRAQERLEKMKQELQEQARKKAIEEATERSYLVQPPPQVEWWDEGLVRDGSYAGIDAADGIKMDIITEYVQHPVLLEPPQDKRAVQVKPMYLTKKERKKMRRQRRLEVNKEEQMKIRLGLVKPPEPKVKLANMMRVLGEDAVKDPTAVEAKVIRQAQARQDNHEKTNEERKLTKEQKHEKLERQKQMDTDKGLKVAVFRVEKLSYGKHRYQIDVNAKQMGLSGMVILHPKMNLVIVEGGQHGVNAYKKLMLRRIKWAENAAPVAGREPPKDSEEREWLQPLDEHGRVKDLSDNRCTLVWEGEEKDKAFRRWASKVCETDGEAKDALARMKMENMWTLAQSVPIE